MSSSSSHGYAVVEQNAKGRTILVPTVNASKVGAMVDWLSIYCKIAPPAAASDIQIQDMFNEMSNNVASVVEVSISEVR